MKTTLIILFFLSVHLTLRKFPSLQSILSIQHFESIETTSTVEYIEYKSPLSPVDFNITRYTPGDCIGDNIQFQLQTLNFSQHTQEEIDAKRYEWQEFAKYELDLMPTFHQASEQQQKSFQRPMQGRGIVSYVNSQTSIDFLTVTIRVLRKSGSKLPIEVYAFANEISLYQQDRIFKLSTPEATVKFFEVDDRRNYLPMSRDLTKKNNWHIKIAAIINCGFEEVLALDSDSVPMKNPGFLFDIPEYVRDGTIFWPDYWKTHSLNPIWRWLDMQCIDEFEQESCAMVINKSRSWRALMLMWFWNRNSESRTFITTYLHGDKDQFRFSWRATNTSYHMVQNWLSSAGFLLSDSKTFCGVTAIQYHPSDSHRDEPLFAHINFMKYNIFDSQYFNFENPMVSVIKKYKFENQVGWEHPEGKVSGTKLSFGHMRKHMWTTRAFFTSRKQNGILYNCVDFMEFVGTPTELVPIDIDFASDLMKKFEMRYEWGL
ncbi:hypothetical protein HK096_009723 [Nowakowskiella sp. JEL0078]|nr:hypothetical protein HK096_009723 [Nowakowskiella sp. JEL0078]